MQKRDSSVNKPAYQRQASADSSTRGRKKKATPDVTTLSQSFVLKTKKQQVIPTVSFAIPTNLEGNDEATIQFLNEQLSQVNRDIEKLNNKKDQITNLLMDILQKKNKRHETMRDENEEENENSKYNFVNYSRLRSSSQNNTNNNNQGSNQKSNINNNKTTTSSSLYQLAMQQNWNIDTTRFRDDPYNDGDSQLSSSSSHKSSSGNKKLNDVSSILNELQTSKSMLKSKINDKTAFNNTSNISNNNNNNSQFSHTLNAQAMNDNSNIYQSFLYQDNSQKPLGSQSKLNEYNKLKERCLWQHFDYKETIQEKLKNVDSLEDNQLKDLAKTFGIKSNDSKLLKENLNNIYNFLARNKFPEQYLREFKTCIHDKIDIL